jgi:hypothetical protein
VSREPGFDPEHEALMADSVGLALLVMLDTLSPAERVAFVLHDTFDLSFDEIAPIIGRTPTAARQLASRARRRVRGASAGPSPDLTRQREVVDASSPPRAAATSKRFSPCSTRTWCCERTERSSSRASGGRPATPRSSPRRLVAQTRWHGRSPDAPSLRDGHS